MGLNIVVALMGSFEILIECARRGQWLAFCMLFPSCVLLYLITICAIRAKACRECLVLGSS
jgi:hypothetical protein